MQLAIDLLTLLGTLSGVAISLLVYLRERPTDAPIATADLHPVKGHADWLQLVVTAQNVASEVWTLRSVRVVAPRQVKGANSTDAMRSDGLGGRRFSPEAATSAATQSIPIGQRIAPYGTAGIPAIANTGDRIQIAVYLFVPAHLKRPFPVRVALDLVDNAIKIKTRTIRFTRLVPSVASLTSIESAS